MYFLLVRYADLIINEILSFKVTKHGDPFIQRTVTKKSVRRKNWSPPDRFWLSKLVPPCQFWSPRENVYLQQFGYMHGLPAHAATGCSDCHCSYRPYTSYTQCTTDLVSRARPFPSLFQLTRAKKEGARIKKRAWLARPQVIGLIGYPCQTCKS